MSFEVLAARARGLSTRRVSEEPVGSARSIEDALRQRASAELALLVRWAGGDDTLVALELDEDRRALRAIARGVVATIAAPQRLSGAVVTRTLPARRLAEVANATSFAEMREALEDHPLAPAFEAPDLLDVELALARRYFEIARPRDLAHAIYLAQLVDAENAEAALLLAARGGDIDHERMFVEPVREVRKHRRLSRPDFLAACASVEAARERLARVFAGTPLASAVFAASPSALEEAALRWQLETQARLRRTEPLGLAPVLYLVLRRRDEARRLRRAAWILALGGGP